MADAAFFEYIKAFSQEFCKPGEVKSPEHIYEAMLNPPIACHIDSIIQSVGVLPVAIDLIDKHNSIVATDIVHFMPAYQPKQKGNDSFHQRIQLINHQHYEFLYLIKQIIPDLIRYRLGFGHVRFRLVIVFHEVLDDYIVVPQLEAALGSCYNNNDAWYDYKQKVEQLRRDYETSRSYSTQTYPVTKYYPVTALNCGNNYVQHSTTPVVRAMNLQRLLHADIRISSIGKMNAYTQKPLILQEVENQQTGPKHNNMNGKSLADDDLSFSSNPVGAQQVTPIEVVPRDKYRSRMKLLRDLTLVPESALLLPPHYTLVNNETPRILDTVEMTSQIISTLIMYCFFPDAPSKGIPAVQLGHDKQGARGSIVDHSESTNAMKIFVNHALDSISRIYWTTIYTTGKHNARMRLRILSITEQPLALQTLHGFSDHQQQQAAYELNLLELDIKEKLADVQLISAEAQKKTSDAAMVSAKASATAAEKKTNH